MESSSSIVERLSRIEKQNRRLRTGVGLLTIALFALGAMGAAANAPDGEFNRVTAKQLLIVDDQGNELILIGREEKVGTGMRIRNAAGKRVLRLGVAANGDGSGILIADKTGMARIGIGMDQGVPSLAITNLKGKKVLGLGGDEKGYGFVVMDENETERVGMGYQAGNTGMALYDANGAYIRGMIQQKDGVHFSSYVDEDGKERYVR